MKNFFLIFALFSFGLTACTSFNGPKPDFSLRGEAAEKEISNYTLNTGFFDYGTAVHQMGPNYTEYKASSLRPFILEVSPSSQDKLRKADQWEWATWTFFAISLGLGMTNNSGNQTALNVSTILFLGSGFYGHHLLGEALEQYNQDLKQKFDPKLSLSFSF